MSDVSNLSAAKLELSVDAKACENSYQLSTAVQGTWSLTNNSFELFGSAGTFEDRSHQSDQGTVQATSNRLD